jgi:hypothetical protein
MASGKVGGPCKLLLVCLTLTKPCEVYTVTTVTLESVPWCYVHPRTDHATFRPAWNVHWEFWPLWHLDPVTFYYCDASPPIWYVQGTNVHSPQSWTFCHCVRVSTVFFLDCERMSTFLWSEMWTFCHMSPGKGGHVALKSAIPQVYFCCAAMQKLGFQRRNWTPGALNF